ncbi:MAG TPA: SHOCT domain-containing protein [Aeromicrobium sp.]|nr:SHOCT domain-containing protein [Aeromicrobium sp.]
MGLLRTAGRVAVASSVHGRVQRRQQQRWAAQDATVAQQQFAAPQVAQPAPAALPAEDPTIAKLKQLAQLRDEGILTEEEFSAKKAQVLGL